MKLPVRILALLAAIALPAMAQPLLAADRTLLNVSYDPTRELYGEINKAFAEKVARETGDRVSVSQSHAGSGAQARAVGEGLEADVVTLAVATDIDQIARRGVIAENWQSRLPDNAAPFTSTIVFLVRKGNPKQIRDWDDLIKPGIGIVTPNPKTSGGARWNYLAAWGFAVRKLGSDTEAEAFVKKLFANVLVMDNGARGATTTFVNRGTGDVLLAWENEAYLARASAGEEVEIVSPSLSIVAEPPVAVVDKYATKHGTTALAENYLKFLYTDAAQEIIARHYYRPRNKVAAAKAKAQLTPIETFTVESQFGGWAKAQAAHFASGGSFDRIYAR